MIRFILAAVAVLHMLPLSAQRSEKFNRIFQLSLMPALGTNGLHPAGFSNYFSLNFTSGYSAANYLLEIGIISNLNLRETRGLQLAGIGNVTGANSFAGMQAREIDKKIREGFEANLSGAQLAGVANVVLNNVFGWQASGGFNLAKGALMGFQLAGISNTVYKYSFGVQLAGLYNVSGESMDGVQVAGLFNITEGGLFGVQVGIINRAGFTNGINTFPATEDPTGVQVGVVNIARKMNGFQVGLVNFGRRMQGTQVGLINIFNDGRDPQTRDGTAIGLLNVGSAFYLSGYASDLFLSNIEIGTGTTKNRRIASDGVEKRVMNALIYGNDPRFLGERHQWAIGYGLKKFYFNRSLMPGMNRMRFICFGVDAMHINHVRKKITKELSLLTRPNITVGSRVHPKNRTFFFFAAAAYNVYRSASGKVMASFSGTSSGDWQHGPGFAAGVMVQ